MKNIKLNNETEIDLSKLIDSRLLVQANSGGGKSWILRRILEQSHGKVQQIIIDPEGEFSTLREKYDYILCGKDADVPADSRSAALLAHRLLEFKTSAIIDLYELHPQERKHFVRLFLEALINSPKHLWHPVIVVIDEAHTFVPEKGDSEASNSVIGLASLGRKRGFCAVLATQRISKLHKDAAAECNNKLIGRTALDIDRKRASEELGFASKEQSLSLRTLEPGSFFGFGPAISNEVIEVKVGEVETTHPKAGSRRAVKLAPPTESVKKILAKLADLPAEAKKEADDIAGLKKANAELKRMNTNLLKNPYQKDLDPRILEKAVKDAVSKRDLEWGKKISAATHYFMDLEKIFNTMWQSFLKEEKKRPVFEKPDSKWFLQNANSSQLKMVPPPHIKVEEWKDVVGSLGTDIAKFGSGEKVILNAIAGDPNGITTEHIAVLTGYKATSRREYLRKLVARGYVRAQGELYLATHEGITALGDSFSPLPTGIELQSHLIATLPDGEKRILRVILDAHPDPVDRAFIEGATNYKTTSVREYLRKLSARKVIEIEGPMIKASDKLF